MVGRNSGRKSNIFVAVTSVILLSLFLSLLSSFVPIVYRNIKNFSRKLIYELKTDKSPSTLVPIVLAFDNEYIYPSLVFLWSLLSTSDSDTFYDLYFFITDEFSQENKQKILELKNSFFNFEVNFVDVSAKKDVFDDVEVFSERFTKEMFYRLMIQDFLLRFDKCIYLDVDMIVRKDLKPLFLQDVTDFYIAAVPDGTRADPMGNDPNEDYEKKSKERKEAAKILGLPDFKRYINSGVVLWNLKKCREDDMSRIFLDFVKKYKDKPDGSLCDQDVINTNCYHKIKDLPLEFNAQTYFQLHRPYADVIPSFSNSSYIFTEEEWNKARSDPYIIHFAFKKPWSQLDIYFAEKWWENAKRCGHREQILNKYIFKIK
ncbi:MAG: glycosyltransferase family 8 protein [Oscillospiraceae bacterium]|jgi:lipopolysaccharide biosynthesis glycosyltransferase|nr:glycosyltransferase family 8 protein [Oscillospiraceae bacterium]